VTTGHAAKVVQLNQIFFLMTIGECESFDQQILGLECHMLHLIETIDDHWSNLVKIHITKQ
jgi:hypothetical protein